MGVEEGTEGPLKRVNKIKALFHCLLNESLVSLFVSLSSFPCFPCYQVGSFSYCLGMPKFQTKPVRWPGMAEKHLGTPFYLGNKVHSVAS